MIDREEKCLGQALSAIGRRRGAGLRCFVFTLLVFIRVFRVNPRQKPFSVRQCTMAWAFAEEYT